MSIWWLTNFRRLGAEKRAVEAVAAEGWFELHHWGFFDAKFSAFGEILAHGVRYPVRLIYPDQFPDVPAWVEPQEDVRWSTHQYGSGGILCLELRPDNWVATATGADVLRSAYNLLLIENPLGLQAIPESAPSAHHVGEVQTYHWGASPVLIGAGCRDRVRAGSAEDLRALRWMVRFDVWPIIVHDAVDRAAPQHVPGPDLNTWRFELPVHVSTNVAPAEIADRGQLIEQAGFGEAIGAEIAAGAAVVIFAGGPELIAYHVIDGGPPHRRKLFVLPDDFGARSARGAASSAKRVAIVGAGSIGSKIAESLVRSGIRRLTVVDGDVMLPGNLERHVLDWRDVGFRKAHGLQQRLLDIAPPVDVTVIDQNLNWQRSAKTHAEQVAAVAACDVIIDATGDAPTSLFLGAIAAANRKPFVSVEVLAGGIGALVASCLPGRDPPFVAARAAFLAWCDLKNVVPPSPGPRRYDALAEDGTPFTADDAAVSMAAAHATRVVLDILDDDPAPPEAAWILFGFRKAWLFDGHGHTIRLSVGSPEDTSEEIGDAEAEAFVLDLAEKYLGEDSSRP